MFKLSSIITVISCLLFSACSGTNKPIKPPTGAMDYSANEYLIGVSDQISVSVWKYPDLSVVIPVRPDGKISVPLVGDVLAAGFGPETLAKNISSELKNYIRNPEVTVLVTSPSSTAFLQRVRVTGAVVNPTSVPYKKGMTVLDIVLLAGGVNDFASPNKSKLYRKNDVTTKSYPIYLSDILNKGELETNYDLLPSDIVIVPERSF